MMTEEQKKKVSERLRPYQFGQPGGNTQYPILEARRIRDFYRWVMEDGTEEQLKEYANDKTKPLLKRRFIQLILHSTKISDFLNVTEQYAGKPEQVVRTDDAKITLIYNRGKSHETETAPEDVNEFDDGTI